MKSTLACTLAIMGFGFAQDSPIDIAKKDLPKSAHCIVCESGGSSHGEEKPAAGVRYKGKEYFFCAAKELAEFKKDPEGFMPPVLPRPAPGVSFKSLSGETVKLADLKGKPLLVDFWATWCKPCIETMPDVQKLHEKYADKGLTALGVSIDEEGAKKVNPFLSKRKFTYRILLDGNMAWKAFGIRAIPALLLIDKDGNIVKQWTGRPDMKDLDQAVSALMK
jgi:thiol-disulfide isomerase/thioredoxin